MVYSINSFPFHPERRGGPENLTYSSLLRRTLLRRYTSGRLQIPFLVTMMLLLSGSLYYLRRSAFAELLQPIF